MRQAVRRWGAGRCHIYRTSAVDLNSATGAPFVAVCTELLRYGQSREEGVSLVLGLREAPAE